MPRLYNHARLLIFDALVGFSERRLEDAVVALAFLGRQRRLANEALDGAEEDLREEITGLQEKLKAASAARHRVAALLSRP
jgi:hypothetical protein